MSADNQQDTSQETASSEASKGNKELSDTLSAIQEQLQAVNQRLESQQAAIAEASRKSEPRDEEDDNLYDPKKLLNKASQIMGETYRQERQKDAVIFNLAQEFPEIQTDKKVRQAVLEAQKSLPKHLQDTAEGYELAVRKATSGLVPKSQRQTVDEDISVGPRGGSASKTAKRAKVSEATLAAAELMGVNINDKAVQERLEQYTNRDYKRYR